MAEEPDRISALLEARLEAALVEFRTEIKAMQKALALAQEYPTAIDKAVGHLKELYGERFEALEKRLAEQREASEKASLKAEQSFEAQLKQTERTHESRHENTRTLIGAIKERMSLLEGAKIGSGTMWGWVVGLIGLVFAALAIGVRVP